MFELEKEMIPVLRKYLSAKYQIPDKCFINEFNSGNGIADLVFSKERKKNRKPMQLDYESWYTTLKYFNRKNKKIEIKKIINDTFLTKNQALKLIKFLVENRLVEKIDEDKFFVKNTYTPPIKKIISIEAKLTDWKKGFQQALRYKMYSHESYLAISENFAHRVDLKLLSEHKIGLITVSHNRINIVLKAKSEKPTNSVAHAFLSEKIMELTYA